jgi:hypothetical protein
LTSRLTGRMCVPWIPRERSLKGSTVCAIISAFSFGRARRNLQAGRIKFGLFGKTAPKTVSGRRLLGFFVNTWRRAEDRLIQPSRSALRAFGRALSLSQLRYQLKCFCDMAHFCRSRTSAL